MNVSIQAAPSPSNPPTSKSPVKATLGVDSRFAAVLQKTQSQLPAGTSPPDGAHLLTVQSGDTLTGLVKNRYRAQGLHINESDAYRQALQLARDNQIKNPDLIQPGKTLRMDAVVRAIASIEPTAPQARPASAPDIPVAATQHSREVAEADTKPQDNHLLDKTLKRAVDKGYLHPGEAQVAARKVLALSEKYKFQPDDFARLTLMESGGMNPKASNGQCHGIIQFCDGASRGAAAVGLANNPRAILGMGLLQQLDLVDAYFDHVGLAESPKSVSLDELYLTVLRPAARSEQRLNAPLAIPGRQARDLHVGGNRNAPITRHSIVEGLHALARRIFESDSPSRRQLSLYTSHAQPDG